VDRLLGELEEAVANSPRIPLTARVLVDEDRIYDLIDALRDALPQAMQQAQWVLRERENLLAQARQQARSTELMGGSTPDAEEVGVLTSANQQAEQILQKAREVAREIHQGAKAYARDLLIKVERTLVETLETVRQGQRELESPDKPPRGNEG